MTTAADTILTIKAAIPGVCGPKLSQITRAYNYVNEKGTDISLILTGLNAICGGIFLQKAGLSVTITVAETDIISAALLNAGETAPIDIALKNKVGTAELTTTAQDLSGAVNEHDGEIGSINSLTTTTKASIVGAINEHDAEIGIINSLTTNARNNLVAAINEHDIEIGNLNLLNTNTNAKNNLVAAINWVISQGGGGVEYYTPIGNIGTYNACGQMVSGSMILKEMVAAQQRCFRLIHDGWLYSS